MHVCHRGFPSLYIVFLYMAKNPCTPSSRPDWLEFRLERPVHTTQEKLNSVKMASLYMSSRSSVDRAQARCSGGHGCDSCRGLRFVLCPILVSCRLIHLYYRAQNSPSLFTYQRSFISSTMLTVHTNPSRKQCVFENAPQTGRIWKRRLFVFVLSKNILKTKLFENDDVTTIMWFSRPKFPQIQILNDRWLSRFQISPSLCSRGPNIKSSSYVHCVLTYFVLFFFCF